MIEFFEPGKVSVCLDSAAGSSGKGSISPFMAITGKPILGAVCTSNQTNAGHQTVLSKSEYTGNVIEPCDCFKIEDDDHYRIILKSLPSSALVTEQIPICIMADAAFTIDRLLQEISLIKDKSRIKIHPRACVVTKECKERSAKNEHVSGTMSGAGPAQAKKLMRDADCKLAKDYPEITEFIADPCGIVQQALLGDKAVLFESSQGFELSLNHGFPDDWPKLTSRDVTPAIAMNSCGVSPKRFGKSMANIRPFPIRVGNYNGNSSGSFYNSKELTWDIIDRFSGAAEAGKSTLEITTVTGRVRRCFTFSLEQFIRMCRYCEPDYLALTFTSQIDYRSFGAKKLSDIPEEALIKIAEFSAMLEDYSGVKVAVLGTGPKNDEQLDVLDDIHFQQLVSEAKKSGRSKLVLAEIDRKIAELEGNCNK